MRRRWQRCGQAFARSPRRCGIKPPQPGPRSFALVQAALAARGFDAAQAHLGALAQLNGLIEQQARLIACEDIYRLIAVLALGAAAYVLLQRRLA
ncbi:hypothetical protein CNECB9_2860002 [Cupriavidus necator]|uniref:Uncharacterized protein n=1 Tax=Cupriavidus necator TaxID=106590 RepID=A0A1K0JAR5_CUPNE|nr:hypothetical protein CNECB9_2860002 [Cupriavidus necator]